MPELLSVDGPADGVATLTLQRPNKRNALSTALRDEISDALDALAADEELRCLIITGAGRVFCAGFDLREFEVDDPEFQRALEAGPDSEVANHPALAEALADPTLESAFRDLGLTDTPEQERELRLKLASTMSLVHRRLRQLQSDDEFLRIMNEPTFKAAVEAKDVLKLLRHRDMARFLELIVQGTPGHEEKTEPPLPE